MASGGINGLSIGVTTVGAVLVYAGFRGVSPLEVFKELSSGKLQPVVGNPTPNPIASGGGGGSSSGLVGPQRSAVVAAAQKYTGDVYSQTKRTQPGYSDCSSFVDKALKDAGIKPPFNDWANTALFRTSPQWKTIPATQALPGDIAISAAHMVLITAAGGTQGIGQERPTVNVKTGTMKELFGSQSFVFKTYTGYTAPGTAGGGGGGGGGGSF
ncbi:MAG TPA: peptidoglycan amidohydrolase family protein [Mycobacterium sp.]|uniref:peptidoglycan amidohydrolase family protein n=1 Tax=Mycobacterium sp. TaxID=1785 RepID=UPI002F4167EA